MKRIVTFGWLIMMMLSTQPVIASHYMGGEITWECTQQGNFRFTMKLYRECYTSGGSQSANFSATETMNTSVPGFPSIQMTRISVTDLSPQCGCPGGPNITCPGMPNGAANMGALQEQIYTSDGLYPNGIPITGVPPVTGWSFSYTSCCRNNSANIPGQPGWWIRAKMYPYNNTSVNNCFDNSPEFNERPSMVICSGYQSLYAQKASDRDADSLSFDWAEPYSSANIAIVNYSPGYSYAQPLPGPFHNPNNSAAQLDPFTGDIVFTSYTNGAFVIVIKATAFKNGIKVAEIFREMQVVILSCQSNLPPSATVPFPLAPGSSNHYIDTVPAGGLVTFPIWVYDYEFCQDTTVMQTVSLFAGGNQFDAPINAAPCNTPPCATLTPSPTTNTPVSGSGNIMTQFSWIPSIQHLDYSNGLLVPKDHHFHFTIMDDACPVPGKQGFTVTLRVIPSQLQPAAEISCLTLIPNGDVHLGWAPVSNASGTFSHYRIMSAGAMSGPYTIVADIHNLLAGSFTHTGAGGLTGTRFYAIETHYTDSVNPFGISLHLATPIVLSLQTTTAATGEVKLNWNPTHQQKLPNASGVYEIYRSHQPGIWQLLDTTSFTQFTDLIPYQNQLVMYKIETQVQLNPSPVSNCKSVSNTVSAVLNSIEMPAATNPEIAIIPNPSDGTFLVVTPELSGVFTLRITTLSGAVIHQSEAFLNPDNPCSFNLPGIGSGIYLLSLANESMALKTRMVIQK